MGRNSLWLTLEYADDNVVLLPIRQELDDGVPKVMAHFEKWGLEVHYGSIGSLIRPKRAGN